MVRVILNGCNGKMGSVISDLAQEEKNIEIVAGIDPYGDANNKYPVFKNLSSCTKEADVLIDFSSAEATEELFSICEEKKLPMVIGTTGFTEAQMERMEETSKRIPILFSANMSIGIEVLKKTLRLVTRELVREDFDIEILENHHAQKEDVPSGTALALAEVINETMENQFIYQYNRNKKKRQKNEIGIASLRGGTVPGDHEVIFSGTEEVIIFQHRAYSRKIFGKGALQAARFLAGKPSGKYTMSNII